MKYIYKHFVASTFEDLWVICTGQLLQLTHYSMNIFLFLLSCTQFEVVKH